MGATHLGFMMSSSLFPAAPDDLLTMARSLDAESLARVIALRDWLITVAGQMEDSNEVLSGFLNRLIELGHRRIGFLTLPKALVAQRLRLGGYKRALAEAGLSYDPSLVAAVDSEGTPREAQRISAAIDRFRAMREPPTVVCCGNDRLAVGVYGILRSKGIRVPAVMSVAGYDDYRVISETLFPPLTTVELPYRAMGERAGELLLSILRGTPASELPQVTRVPGAVFWRGSVTDKPNNQKPAKSKRRK